MPVTLERENMIRKLLSAEGPEDQWYDPLPHELLELLDAARSEIKQLKALCATYESNLKSGKND